MQKKKQKLLRLPVTISVAAMLVLQCQTVKAADADLNAYMRMMEVQIAVDHAGDKLTGAQAKKLAAQIDKIKSNVNGLQMEDEATAHDLSPYLLQIYAISDCIAREMRMKSKVVDDFDNRAATLEWLIAKAKMGDQLSITEIAAANDELSRLRRKHADGHLTQGKCRVLMRQLFSLNDRIIACMFHPDLVHKQLAASHAPPPGQISQSHSLIRNLVE